MKVLCWYNCHLSTKPIFTKCLKSFFTFGLGDFICQSFEKNSAKIKCKTKNFNLLRMFKQTFFDFALSPYFHFHVTKIIQFLFPIKPGINTNKRVLKSLVMIKQYTLVSLRFYFIHI